VFRLREGVRRHDGRILVAADVVDALTRARDDPRSRRTPEVSMIRTVLAPDPHTVVFRTEAPCGPLPLRLARVLLSFDPATAGDAPVGTGPYRLKSWDPAGDTLLEAFDAYWNGVPAIRHVEFRALPDARERVRRLRDHVVDLVLDVPAEDFAVLRDVAGVRTVARRGVRIVYLGPNCMPGRNAQTDQPQNPFADVRVRRAAALAIDREALVRGALGGHADAVDQLVPPEVFGHHPSLPTRKHDPAAARRLLAEAGYPQGFSTSIDFPQERYRAIGEVVAQLAADLAEVGIRVTPRPAELPAFTDRVDERHDFGLFVAGWLTSAGDAGLVYDSVIRSASTPGFGHFNAGGYSSPEVDRLLREQIGRLSSRERARLLAAVAARVHADVPVIPLYRQHDLYAFADNLLFEPRADRRVRADQIRWK
jgi:peptide/nickel transport system substrate-binding protein